MKEVLEVLVPGVVSCFIAYLGLRVAADQVNKHGLNSVTMQLLGLALFLPTIIIVSGLGEFDSNGLATLLGALAGYLFGKHTEALNRIPNAMGAASSDS